MDRKESKRLEYTQTSDFVVYREAGLHTHRYIILDLRHTQYERKSSLPSVEALIESVTQTRDGAKNNLSQTTQLARPQPSPDGVVTL